MTVAEAVRAAAQRLQATSETARLDAELLMAHLLRIGRSETLLHRMQDRAPSGYDLLVERRAGCEPIAYITGRCSFFGREFLVNRAVLIPRADSETVIDAALCALGNLEEGQILDLGTGSGALLLTLLAEREGFRGTGLDRSQAALAVASENAERLGLTGRSRFLEADWSEEGDQGGFWTEGLDRVDLVIANPPYVETDAELTIDVRNFEPAGALFAGSDGLDDYRRLIPSLPELMLPGAKAVLEIGASQSRAVAELAEKEGLDAELRHDLANRPRALILS
ncbi:MAG: peptide chain release factor N(5)-glutamine methyltransferase [Pseudomonadota bacterium]